MLCTIINNYESYKSDNDANIYLTDRVRLTLGIRMTQKGEAEGAGTASLAEQYLYNSYSYMIYFSTLILKK